MSWLEFQEKNPLAQHTYTRAQVEQLRLQAYRAGFGSDKKPRSMKQHGYYRKCLIKPMALHTGYDKEEMHKKMAEMFLKYVDEFGVEKVRSTADLSTVEHEEYNTSVRMFAAEYLGMYLPLPNETEFSYEAEGNNDRSRVSNPAKQNQCD